MGGVNNMFSWIILLISVFAPCQSIVTEVNTNVTLVCPLTTSSIPLWVGPNTLATPLTSAGGVVNQPGMSYVNDKDLYIESATTNHTGDYKCNDGVGEALVRLDVHAYEPEMNWITNSAHDLVVKGNLYNTHVCQVVGAYPEPVVTVDFNNLSDDLKNLTKLTVNVTSELQPDNTYTLNATATFIGLKEMYQGFIECNAKFEGRSIYEYVRQRMALIVPPTLLSIVTYPGDEEDPVNKFNCGTETTPKTYHSWSYEGQIYETQTNCTLRGEYYLYTCQSKFELKDLTREDNGKPVTCVMKYKGVENYQNTSTAVGFTFAPTVATITGNTSVLADENGNAEFNFTCSFDESTKHAFYLSTRNGFVWELNSERLNNSMYPVEVTPGRFNAQNRSQTIDFVQHKSSNGQTLSCCADSIFKNNIACDTVTLDITYPPEITYPTRTTYLVYEKGSIDIPCYVDSNPIANVMWYKSALVNGSIHWLDGVTSPEKKKVHVLSLTNVGKNDSGTYRCYAWQDPHSSASGVKKEISVTVVDLPPQPQFAIRDDVDSMEYSVTIVTSASVPVTPRSFYIQFKKQSSDIWTEIDREFKDRVPGQEVTSTTFKFPDDILDAKSVYDVRIKSVDIDGLVMFSAEKQISVEDTAESVEEARRNQVDTMNKYTEEEWRNTILISVFATAAVFLVIIIGMVVCIKRGGCSSSSSKSYAM